MNTSFSLARFRAPLAVATLGVGLMLSSCGGGGNGPTLPIPSNTATPPTTPGPGRVFTPNYIAEIDTLRRWRQFPVRVSFVRNGDYSAAAQQRALAGFEFWLAQIPNGPTFTIVPEAQTSDLKVTFNQFDSVSSNILGTTRVFSSSDPNFVGVIARAEMSLGITGNNTLDIATAAHEYGHALGILDHSKNPDDLMFFQGNDTLSGQLTRADVNTMLTNYGGLFPKNGNTRLAPIPGPFEVTEIN